MTACKRAWEVEAARDGRLGTIERQNLAQHLAACASCRQEREALDELGARLRAVPVPPTDDVGVRRSRKLILERANEERYDLRRRQALAPYRRAHAGLAAVFALGLASGIGVLWHSQQATSNPELTFEVDPDTRYERTDVDGAVLVHLTHGRLTLHIAKGERDHGVLVRTPDGEIEDVGTVFTVDVDEGRTRYVGVREGRVLMKLEGQPQRLVEAGQSVHPYDKLPEPPAPVAATPPALPTPPPQLPPTVQVHPSARTTHRHHAAKHAPPEEPESESDAGVDTAAEEFTAAVTRFEAGDLASAAALLHRFVRRHPDDVRAEDASFLRVVALTRANQRDEARAAADAYLNRHPGGFRAKEVERLLGESKRTGD